MTITIIEDTSQKIGQHNNISEWCAANGVKLIRQKLNVGDYQTPPRVAVDTKKGMAEIYQDLIGEHERFRAECIRAQEDGIKLIILIEEEEISCLEEAEHWKNPRQKKWERDNAFIARAQAKGKMLNHKIPKPPVSSDRLVGMMRAMEMKYGVKWFFCHPDKTGETIYSILSAWR